MDMIRRFGHVDGSVQGDAVKFEGRGLRTDGICGGCKYATVLRRRTKSQLRIMCGKLGEIDDDVEECSGFNPHSRMEIWEMEEKAIVIDKRKGVNDKSFL
jgi:hypothetical protein